jgi:hypothetical protein
LRAVGERCSTPVALESPDERGVTLGESDNSLM